MGENYKFTFKKMMLHLKTIITHKHWVFVYCCKCGIPWQGIIHDLSKFSFAEFIPNVKYVRKGISPIEVQKQELGFAASWLHHKGRNPHHYVYWMDEFDRGCYVTRMPYKYAVEMICDHLGANIAYKGKSATYRDEYEWWKKERGIRNKHPDTTKFLEVIFSELYIYEPYMHKENHKSDKDILNKKHLKEVYDTILKESEYDLQVKIRQPK